MNRRRRARREELLAPLKAGGCCDCGEQDPDVLQFDHVPERGPKLFSIQGTGLGTSLALLAEELAKCDVVCANCHMRRTKRRGQQAGPPRKD